MEILQTKEFWYFFIPVALTILFYFISKSNKDERQHLLVMYKLTQASSKRVQEKIKYLINECALGSHKAFIKRDMSYSSYLDMLELDYEKSLSEKMYEQIKNDRSFSKPVLISMTEMITKHSEEFRVIELELDLIIKQYKRA